jgi:heme exporter protein CcmD
MFGAYTAYVLACYGAAALFMGGLAFWLLFERSRLMKKLKDYSDSAAGGPVSRSKSHD